MNETEYVRNFVTSIGYLGGLKYDAKRELLISNPRNLPFMQGRGFSESEIENIKSGGLFGRQIAEAAANLYAGLLLSAESQVKPYGWDKADYAASIDFGLVTCTVTLQHRCGGIIRLADVYFDRLTGKILQCSMELA